MEFTPEDVGKCLPPSRPGLIGAERELRDKAAGFRTIIFVCLGATLFTLFSLKLGGDEDPVRIAANVVTGIGFLGAGAILREGLRVRGLTTAAAIWLSAALGMGIAGGHYSLVAIAVGVALVVIWIFPIFEGWLDHLSENRTYQVTCRADLDKLSELEAVLRDAGLQFRAQRKTRSGDEMICTWDAKGRAAAHEKAVRTLFRDPDVKELAF